MWLYSCPITLIGKVFICHTLLWGICGTSNNCGYVGTFLDSIFVLWSISFSQHNKSRKGKQRQKHWEKKYKTVHICRCYDCVHKKKKSLRVIKKPLRTSKWVPKFLEQKINTWKSIIFLCNSNKHIGTEGKKAIPLAIALRKSEILMCQYNMNICEWGFPRELEERSNNDNGLEMEIYEELQM